MKLTVEDALALQSGLQALDEKFDKIIEDGRNSKKVVSVHYDLSKKVRIENGIRLHLLQAPLKAYQKIRDELLQKYGEAVGDDFKVPGRSMGEFQKENRDAMAVEFEAGDLPELDFGDLKLDDNPIPGSVLMLLEPIKKNG